VEVQVQAILTSALDGDEWPVSGPGRFPPGERARCIHCLGSWVGPRAGMKAVEWRKNPSFPLPETECHLSSL